MIPNKLHHIWLQGGIPDKYKKNYDKWDEFLSTWEHKVWNEESLLTLCSDSQVEKYMKIETLINRVNYLKYILMYNEGGVFVDLDTIPLLDLNEFFNNVEIKDIDLESLLSIRYPFNTEIPNKPFGDYDIILTGRKTTMYYPNGDRAVLIDNPVLMSGRKDSFWLDLIKWCEQRTNLKPGALAEMEFLSHEPYGPYGITDFVFKNYNEPYKQGILILPATYLMGANELNNNMYILHSADCGW